MGLLQIDTAVRRFMAATGPVTWLTSNLTLINTTSYKTHSGRLEWSRFCS